MAPSNLKFFLKGLTNQTLVTIVMGVVSMVFFSIMSRLLSKTDFGYYAALMGITEIFMSFSSAGIGASVIQKKDIDDNYVSTAFYLTCIISGLITIIYLSLSGLLAELLVDNYLVLPLKLMAFVLIFQSLVGYAQGILYRKFEFAKVGIIKVCSYTISAVLGIYLAYEGFKIFSLVYFYIANATLTMVFLFLYGVRIPKFHIDIKSSKEILNFGGWLTAGVIMNNINNQIDKLLLPRILSISALGAYNRPAGFINNLISQINSVFDTVLFPHLSDIKNSNNKVQSAFFASFELLNVFGLLLFIMLYFNSDLIVHIFLGSKWKDLTIILNIASLSSIFLINSTLCDCFFRSLNLVKPAFFIRSIGVLITVLFVVLGSHFDIIGVAIAIVLSYTVLVTIKMLFLIHKIGIMLSEVIKIFFISFLPSIPVLLVGCLSLFLDNNFFTNLLILIIMSMTIFVELLLFPKLFGNSYCSMIYPSIRILINKVNMRFNEK